MRTFIEVLLRVVVIQGAKSGAIGNVDLTE